MKQIHVGCFPLGHQNVDLYAFPEEDGGCFYTRPDDKSPARIKVGLNYRHWNEVVDTLLHEAFEMAAARADGRFQLCGNIGRGSDRYHFHFDHNKFSEICSEVSVFITPALPKLAAIYNRRKK